MLRRHLGLKFGILVLLCTCTLTGCQIYYGTFGYSYRPHPSNAQIASDLRRKGEYLDAVDHYRQHMQDRLRDPSRPEDENPYFYETLIGDSYLQAGQPEEAKLAFRRGQEHGMESDVIVDGIRRVAKWYQRHGQLQQAMDTFREIRELDPLIVDSDIDQLHRTMVAAEEKQEMKKIKKKTQAKKPAKVEDKVY